MQKLLLHFCIVIIIFFLPQLTLAAVTINEVAWMGDATSANHEWIELYNSSDTTIDLDGWSLSDGQNLNINLSGALDARSYAVLERTSDESSPGLAFLIYSGALVNTGVTLTIKDPSGTIVEQVAGGENWSSVGGDNATKETAQYTTSGWVTDVATPGRQNATGRTEVVTAPETTVTTATAEQPKSTANQSVSKSRNSSQTVSFKVLDSELILKPEVRSVAYVNQVIPFKVEASGLGRNLLASLVYNWNFGDSYEVNGKEVEHYYAYPGKYVVTLHGKFAKNEAITQVEITVLPVTFSISRSSAGDIQINNNAPYDIDISGYQLMGAKTVVMPKRTIMLAKGTMTIGRDRLEVGNASSHVYLYDTNLNLVASDLPVIKSPEEFLVSNQVMPSTQAKLIDTEGGSLVSKDRFTFATTVEEVLVSDNSTVDLSAVEADAEDGIDSDSVEKNPVRQETKKWPYILFMILLLGAFFAIISGKNRDK